jgi:hypothetical protein
LIILCTFVVAYLVFLDARLKFLTPLLNLINGGELELLTAPGLAGLGGARSQAVDRFKETWTWSHRNSHPNSLSILAECHNTHQLAYGSVSKDEAMNLMKGEISADFISMRQQPALEQYRRFIVLDVEEGGHQDGVSDQHDQNEFFTKGSFLIVGMDYAREVQFSGWLPLNWLQHPKLDHVQQKKLSHNTYETNCVVYIRILFGVTTSDVNEGVYSTTHGTYTSLHALTLITALRTLGLMNLPTSILTYPYVYTIVPFTFSSPTRLRFDMPKPGQQSK